MLALIDGDILVYRLSTGALKTTYKVGMFVTKSEKQAELHAEKKGLKVRKVTMDIGERDLRYNTKHMVDNIVRLAKATEYEMYLTRRSKDNFRLKYVNVVKYKENRKGKERPKYYDFIRKVLTEEYSAIFAEGEEADDALAIRQTARYEQADTIICTVDKDLLMVPGLHYHLDAKNIRLISPLEGIRHFYMQMLTGDTADNIKGIRGVGPVKAKKIINHLTEERDMYTEVCKLYEDQFGVGYEDALREHGIMLWMRRKPGEIWELPVFEEDK